MCLIVQLLLNVKWYDIKVILLVYIHPAGLSHTAGAIED